MIGYKKCIYFDVDKDGAKVKEALVTLEIPAGAKVIRPIDQFAFGVGRRGRPSRKLRCKAAKVLDIVDVETREPVLCAYSAHSMVVYFFNMSYFLPEDRAPKTICTYLKGEMVVADKLDENELVECSSGIHFFLTEEEALRYQF